MKLLRIYQCLCDETRLRIINLLMQGPLCVCHLQEILGQSQVNVSRHLAYLKNRNLVEATRYQNWMIYHLPATRFPELDANLKCLQDCRQTEPVFSRDLASLKNLMKSRSVQEVLAEGCCGIRPNTSASKRAKVAAR